MDALRVHEIPALDLKSALNSGDTGNTTELTGVQVDLQGVTGRRYRKVRVVIPYKVTLNSGITVTIASNLQDRNATTGTGSTWADFGTAPTSHTVTNATTSTGVVTRARFAYEQDLTTARRYLRVQMTPTISTTSTGELMDHGITLMSLFDAIRLPASG